MRIASTLLFITLNTILSFGQNNEKIDSLKAKLETNIHDTVRIKLLTRLCWYHRTFNPQAAIQYAEQSLSMLNRTKYPKGLATTLNMLGVIEKNKGNFDKALDYYLQALKIFEQIELIPGLANCTNNIGVIYYYQKDYKSALKYYYKSLGYERGLNNRGGIADILLNIGVIHMYSNNPDTALHYYLNAYDIYNELEIDHGLASALDNIGQIYLGNEDFVNAIKYFKKSLLFERKLENNIGISISLNNLGEAYLKIAEHDTAIHYFKQSIIKAQIIDFKDIIKHTSKILSNVYALRNQHEDAFQSFQVYDSLKSQLFNEEKSKKIGKLEAKHELEVAEIQRKKQEEERSRQEQLAVSRRNQLQYSGIVLVLVGLFIGIFLFARRFRKIKEYKTFRQYTKIVEAALFISFLIFFEFILVLLDPYIEQITGDAPLWKLGFNALLAGVIFPIHSLLESKLKGQVIKTERKKWVAEAVKGKNLLVVIGLGFVLGLNTSTTLSTGFDASTPFSTGSSKIDSLKNVIATAEHDTIKVKALNELADKFTATRPDTALELAKQALKLSNILEFIKGQIAAYDNIGYVNYVQSDYGQAIANWEKALELAEQQNHFKFTAMVYSNIGSIYAIQSEYHQALSYFLKSLKIEEEGNDKKGMAASYNNIGLIYFYQSSYLQALDYFFKALKTKQEIQDTINRHYANMLNNIGGIYEIQSDYPQALDYHFKSLKIYEELGDKVGIASSYNNIGVIYENQSDYTKALSYYFKSLKMKEQLGDKQSMASSYINIGSLYTIFYKQGDSLEIAGIWTAENPNRLLDSAMYYQQNALLICKELSIERDMSYSLSGIADILMIKEEYSHALEYYHQSSMLADSIGALQRESEVHSELSACYEKLNNHKLALEHYKQYSTLKDSVFNEEKSKDLGKLEAKHEFEMADLKKKQEEEIRSKQLATAVSRRNNLQYSAILIGLFVLFGVLFLLGKLSIPNWLVELSVFIPFLILFEFLLVLLDPHIESWAGSEPAFKLLFNAGLAGMMFPLHQFFEGKLKKRIVKAQRVKLKKRMDQYKRDVEEL